MRRTSILLATMAALSMAGCFSLSKPTPTEREYRLSYPAPPAVEAFSGGRLRIAPVQVTSELDRTRLATRRAGHEVGRYPYDRWTVAPGEMVGDLLRRDFTAEGGWSAVLGGTASGTSDVELIVVLEELAEVMEESGCRAVVSLSARLEGRVGGRNVISLPETTYAESETVACGRPLVLVEALSRALGRVSGRVRCDVHGALSRRP